MTTTTETSATDALRRELAEKPDGVLEAAAARHGVSLLDATRCLPEALWAATAGAHFVEAIEDIASWGDVIIIIHTRDAIFEVEGPMPKGTLGQGFYNLKGGQALSGHLRPERCTDIVFLSRPFMGTPTRSVQFFNAAGEAIFKIFVGRDAARQLKPDQMERFEQLARRLGGVRQVH